MLLAPAERADVVIDFNGASPGQRFILYNDALAPFPAGDPLNDFFTGAPASPGYGPNTRTLMKIVVAAGTGDKIKTSTWLRSLNPLLRAKLSDRKSAASAVPEPF